MFASSRSASTNETEFEAGYASIHGNSNPGPQATAVEGRAPASERLQAERLPNVVKILRTEAKALGERLNPFDPTLRYPARSLSRGAG